ncbi:MAG: hypothetical protein ABDH21_03430 [bacterium]
MIKILQNFLEICKNIESALSSEDIIHNVQNLQNLLEKFLQAYPKVKQGLYILLESKFSNKQIYYDSLEEDLIDLDTRVLEFTQSTQNMINNLLDLTRYNNPYSYKLIEMFSQNLKTQKQNLISMIEEILYLTLTVMEIIEQFENPEEIETEEAGT